MSGTPIDEQLSYKEPEEFETVPMQETPQARGIDLSFLKAKTGEGSIEDYIEHPMNFNRSKSLGQVIRGFTGLIGALDLAVIDIVVGALNFSKERKSSSIA